MGLEAPKKRKKFLITIIVEWLNYKNLKNINTKLNVERKSHSDL